MTGRIRSWGWIALLAICALPVWPAVRGAHGAASRQTLTYGGTQEPDTLNPLLTGTAAGTAIDSAVFEGLLRVDGRNQPAPALATSWSHSADGRTWTFHLRHARFADGVALSSTDVYWTYLSIVNPTNRVSNSQGWDQVQSMRTPDPYTVVIGLKRWLAPWLLQIGTTPILPKHALFRSHTIDVPTFDRTPFGTGPYQVRDWQQGRQITLVANSHYWGGAPSLRTIVYRLYPDDARLLAALRSGEAEMGAVDVGQAVQAGRLPHRRLIATPSMTWYHVDLKQWGFLRDQAMRQALDFATPRDELVRTVLHGYGQVANGDIAPALRDYYDPGVHARPYSPLRAAEILAADGYHPGPDGILQRCDRPGTCQSLRLTLWSIQGDDAARRVNARLASEWGAIGVGVSLRQQEADTIFGATGPQFLHQPTGLTYGWTNAADPDDRFYWNSVYIPASPSAAGGNDIAYFYRFSFQSTIDALTDAAVIQTDPARRRPIYGQIQRLLADQTPVIFLYWPDILTVVPRDLRGFAPSPFAPLFWNVASWR